VNGEDRSKRGKRGGCKRLLELDDGSRRVLPANAPQPEGARDALRPIEEAFGDGDVHALRERVLAQLATGEFTL
jgi:nicotinate phosphoribosyltransferase